MEGEMINERYKAIRKLKEPRNGKIYFLVEDIQNENELKMLKGIALLNEQQKEDAKSEIALLQKLDNDYVVKLLDDFVFTDPNNFTYHALILEYLPGGDLSEYLKEKLLNEGKETEEPWDENETLRITAQLAVALDYVHSQNVIHRDVKPENVLLSADKKTAKLADFNISRTIEATKNTGVAGTMDYHYYLYFHRYFPPETLKNEDIEQVSFRRDLWPLGIIMQMLCTFRHPYAAGNPFQTMMNIAQNIRQPAQVAFPVMESLIKQCLVVEMGERVESVTSLMKQPVLWSLVEQLKNRIKPENLVFGLNRLETKDIIKDHLIAELQRKLEETQKKMADFMEKSTQKNVKTEKNLKEAQKEISKLKTENIEKQEKLEKVLNDIADLKENVKFIAQFISFGSPLEGFGFYNGDDSESVRKQHDEAAVRKVLKAMAAGLTTFNLKFHWQINLEVTEAGWTIRHQSQYKDYGGDGFWKMWLTYNGKRVDFQADADDLRWEIIYTSAKELTPDSSGMVKFKGYSFYVRWNITVKK